MDWNLSSGRNTAYRVSQGIAVLIIGLRFLLTPLTPGAPILVPFALTLAAIFFLASNVRLLGGYNAGAISLVLLSLFPDSGTAPYERPLALFCLSALVTFFATRDYEVHRKNIAGLCAALAVPIALGCCVRLCLLPLSATIAFAYLLLRYVPPDSIRPYPTLLKCLQANHSSARWELLIITVAGLLSLLPLLLFDTSHIQPVVHYASGDPGSHLLAAGRLFFQFLGAGEDLDTLPVLLTPPLLIASGVTLWWLFVSLQSGNGLPFALTAIPVAYLLCGALSLRAGHAYARPVYPILIANLIAFLGLWLRGRANKRVVDSTPD